LEDLPSAARKVGRFFPDDEARKSVRGTPDHATPLTAEGERQARETGGALRQQWGMFDYIYHSGYRRAEQTARGILDAYLESERARLQVRHNLFLRERDSGYAYDMTNAEAEAAFPWLQDYWHTYGAFFARPPGGESLADVAFRVYLFLNMLFRDRAGKRVLVVSHAMTIRTFRFLLERWTYDEAVKHFYEERIPNCAVTTYELDAALGRLKLTRLAETLAGQK